MKDRLPPPGVPWGVSLVLHSNTLLALMFLYLHPHSCDLSLQPDLLTHPDAQVLPAVIHPSEQTITPHVFLLVLLLWKHEENQIDNSNTPNLSSTYLPISLSNLSFTMIIKGCRQLCIFPPHYLYASDLCLFNGQGLLTTEVNVLIIVFSDCSFLASLPPIQRPHFCTCQHFWNLSYNRPVPVLGHIRSQWTGGPFSPSQHMKSWCIDGQGHLTD